MNLEKLSKEQLIEIINAYDQEIKDCMNEKTIGKSRRHVREFLRKLYRKYTS